MAESKPCDKVNGISACEMKWQLISGVGNTVRATSQVLMCELAKELRCLQIPPPLESREEHESHVSQVIDKIVNASAEIILCEFLSFVENLFEDLPSRVCKYKMEIKRLNEVLNGLQNVREPVRKRARSEAARDRGVEGLLGVQQQGDEAGREKSTGEEQTAEGDDRHYLMIVTQRLLMLRRMCDTGINSGGNPGPVAYTEESKALAEAGILKKGECPSYPGPIHSDSSKDGEDTSKQNSCQEKNQNSPEYPHNKINQTEIVTDDLSEQAPAKMEVNPAEYTAVHTADNSHGQRGVHVKTDVGEVDVAPHQNINPEGSDVCVEEGLLGEGHQTSGVKKGDEKCDQKCIKCGRICGSAIPLSKYLPERSQQSSSVKKDRCVVGTKIAAKKKVKKPVKMESTELVSCDKCNILIPGVSRLKNHQKYHTGEHRHLCTVCGKSFPIHLHLKQHMCVRTQANNKQHIQKNKRDF
ncbi:zinc finger protein 184-like [Polypterus senegalus]|uniref:zinc finger protein 184-like n=1 Tax=Polypterus senegalus TaxID=55291 RepID=UPI0019653297|nr:zinc finger protein 184-like [Polypterus senegalus]